jgi:hypothetical protein
MKEEHAGRFRGMCPMRSRVKEQRKCGLGNRSVRRKLMNKNSVKGYFDVICYDVI